MEFLTVRELTASPREAWEKLARDGEVAITNNGKPAAMADESDRKFLDAAKSSGALLITGSKKHYPPEPFILSPAEFLELP